jgi:hypothetical protein
MRIWWSGTEAAAAGDGVLRVPSEVVGVGADFADPEE